MSWIEPETQWGSIQSHNTGILINTALRNLNLSYYFLCRTCAEAATHSRTRLYQKFDTWTASFWWKLGMFRLTGTGQSCLWSSFGHSSYGTYQTPSRRRWASHKSLFIVSLKEWKKPPLVLMLCHVIWFLKPTFIWANFKSAFSGPPFYCHIFYCLPSSPVVHDIPADHV